MDSVFLALRVAATLVAVLAALWFLHRKVSKKLGITGRGKDLTVIQRQALGKSTSVALVGVDGRRLLLGVSEHGINLLTELSPELDAETTETQPAAEADALSGDAQAAEVAEQSGDDVFAKELVNAERALDRGALSGSLLSADTWRRTWGVLKSGGAR